MRATLALLLATALTASTLSGCASFRRAKETHLLSDARQIVATRRHMTAVHPERQVPSLGDVMAQHQLLDAERIEPFEVTDAWANPDADEEIILRQKEPAGGRRVVALGNGRAMVKEEE